MRSFRLLFVVLSLIFIVLNSPSGAAQSTDRAKLQAKIESLRNELKVREKEFLSPSAEDQANFAGFLSVPDTGLIRLLPRPQSEAQAKLTIRGGGAFYSFTRLTHEYGNGSDIMLEAGNLSVGFAGANYGFLATLGDIPLESVNLDTPGVAFLASLKTPSYMTEARERQRQSSDGIVHDAIAYKRMVEAVVGNTYLLRSINHDTSDVLVGFRVVRKDSDGSLIILWKMLQRFPAPTLIRNEN